MNCDNNNWDNQRPPVYNPEDYIQSLKKYCRRPNGSKSVYDTTENVLQQTIINDNNIINNRSAKLPRKNNNNNINNNFNNNNNINKNHTLHDFDDEMTLRQFGSITDLLTKLRADLRASFPIFVQEFVACPLDGTSILLEVLRAVQLSQTLAPTGMTSMPNSLQRNTQSYQRRALLDEMACLQCLSVCCARSPESGARLGTTTVGLLPLAAAATGQGIRSRIIALQLLSVACDKAAIGNGTQRSFATGHSAVSEALSTLRLRCGEPVRFRLLAGMLNSGGGSGELQAVGLRFINTFLESAETTQNRLYIQAELFQAGFDPTSMTKSIASSSPWLEKLRNEVKKWEEIRIDIGRLQIQARESEKLRSQLVISERRVQILQEEKTVLTSMERRLQERCAELQREVFRLQGCGSVSPSTESHEKRPIALPRQVPPHGKGDSEHEDEGISSSETGPSLSPEPPRTFPKQNQPITTQTIKITTGESSTDVRDEDETNTTIDDVIEELKNIVSDAEREIIHKKETNENSSVIIPIPSNEHIIVPVNLLPQPPRKSRSLVHLLSNPSDADGSDYGLLLIHDGSKISFFDDMDFSDKARSKIYMDEIKNESYYNNSDDDDGPDIINHKIKMDKDSNRAILNVIMDAREKEEDDVINLSHNNNIERDNPTPQKFNGVFFMSEMNSPQKYPKPDITAALEAKRVTKNLDRMESYGLDSMIDIVLTSSDKPSNKSSSKLFSSSTKSSPFKIRTGHTNAGLYSGGQHITTRDLVRTIKNSKTSVSCAKLTDLPSGLY